MILEVTNMIHSLTDSELGQREFELLVDQDHMEKVWAVILPTLQKHIDGYLSEVAKYGNGRSPSECCGVFMKDLIRQNDKSHDKNHKIFDLSIMEEEYSEDTQSFKDIALKKDCDVIRSALKSQSEALNEWKGKFRNCKSQTLFDAFYNILTFAAEYDKEMDEGTLSAVDTIDDMGLQQMEEDNCYISGVLGFGTVSSILNSMYPRTFPGNYKKGIYSLFFLTGHGGKKGLGMPSETSEFCMVKDDIPSKTDIIEMEHNYYFPYGTFGIYTLRIYREIQKGLQARFQMEFPSDYRFLLTNDFYEYITASYSEDIRTMTGNDDVLKYNSLW